MIAQASHGLCEPFGSFGSILVSCDNRPNPLQSCLTAVH